MHDRIEPVYAADIHVAAALADHHPGISTRDLLYTAVLQRVGADRIITEDADFDHLPNITRLDPMHVEEWGESVRRGSASSPTLICG